MDQKRALEILEEVDKAYETIAAEFSDTRAEVWPELAFLKQRVQDGMTIADIGCGNGRMLKLFEGKQLTYTGIDNSARLLAFAQTLAPTFPTINATFKKASLLALPIADNSCDAVFCIATLHHIPSYALQLQAVTELYRICKPGGALIMTNWNLAGQLRYWLLQVRLRFSNASWFNGFGLRDFRIPWKLKSGSQINRYYYAFSATELAQLCTKAGFLVEHSAVGGNATDWSKKRKTRNILTLAKKR